jgi:hypothetical protein
MVAVTAMVAKLLVVVAAAAVAAASVLAVVAVFDSLDLVSWLICCV